MLVVIACVTVVGTMFQTYRFDRQLIADGEQQDAVIQQLNATELALSDVRLAQSGYVAVGQSASSWMDQFDEALSRVEGTLRERQQTTSSEGALAHYDAAIELLDMLRTSDGRARNYVKGDQRILASDVIFVESQEIIGRIAANVSAARDTEVFEARQSLMRLTQYRQGLGASGLLFTLLVGVLAYRKTGIGLPEEGPEVVPASVAAAPEAAPAPAPSPIIDQPHLAEAADVCVDLARLLDERDLPALLSRAASAIGAKGLVLWVLDESGQSLRASVAHGYSERMLQRLGQLPVSADNVTSTACRTLQPQWVPGQSADRPAALAVPLVSVSGCVGVLSAEVTNATEDGHQLPLTRLVAAQLSAIIGPDASAAARAAANEL